MLKVKCIHKMRKLNTGEIYGYRIQDEHGRINDVTPNELKNAILNKTVECVNLTLTKDGRLINKTEKAAKATNKYYRYTIWSTYSGNYVGGLFRGINKVLDELNQDAEDGDDLAIEDYEDINRIEGQLEYILKFPNINDSRAIFYFEEEMRNRIVARINEMKHMMEDHGYTIREEVINEPPKSKVIYRDQDQIAIVK